jgi:hypothetical protein
VGKVPLAHQVVGFDDLVNPLAPDTNGDTHDHVLRTFGNLAVNPQKVRSLKGLETELSSNYRSASARRSVSISRGQTHVVVLEVSVVDDGRVERVLVLHNSLVRLIRNHRCGSTIFGID